MGFLFYCVIFSALALLTLRLIPLYLEKTHVDYALNRLVRDPQAGELTKPQMVSALMKQFEVSEQRRWTDAELSRLLVVRAVRDSKRTVTLDYEIRGPLCLNLDVLLNYHWTHELPAISGQ